MEGNSGKRLPKTRRAPEAFLGRALTGRGLRLIEIIGQYRFVGTSAIVRLAGGNEDVTHRHLQMLYHRSFVGRFSRPGASRNTEFAYFLENSPQLRQVLKDHGLKPVLDFDIGGRQNGNRPGRLLFLEHELMISDFHAGVDLAARATSGRVELAEWKQGPSTWDRVPVDGGGVTTVLPHRPDAYFVLRFPTAALGQQHGRFFYEADRDTTNTTRFRLKLQGYLAFFLSGQYQEKYGARRVRAVLVETTSDKRMQQLKSVAADLSEREPFAGALFWFATSGLVRADGGFAAVWATAADERLRSLTD